MASILASSLLSTTTTTTTTSTNNRVKGENRGSSDVNHTDVDMVVDE